MIVCCPLCRAGIPVKNLILGLDDQLCVRVFVLAERAERKVKGSEEQMAMCEEALNIVNELIERDPENVKYNVAKAKTLVVQGNHTFEAIKIIRKAMDINKQKQEKLRKGKEAIASEVAARIAQGDCCPCLREMALKERMEILEDLKGMIPDKIDVLLLLATAIEQEKDWIAASKVYKMLLEMTLDPEIEVPCQQKCDIMIGMSKCFYETGRYHDSIGIGMHALFEVSRSHPGVHKYLALSLKASNALDSAIDVMNCAVLYETPWDDKNRMEALKLFNELSALKANGQK
jgi:tetratricopeptide (TPR) repeat protein